MALIQDDQGFVWFTTQAALVEYDRHRRPLRAKAQPATDQDIPADLPTIAADRDRIIQVLINLISNAVKFTVGIGSSFSFSLSLAKD